VSVPITRSYFSGFSFAHTYRYNLQTYMSWAQFYNQGFKLPSVLVLIIVHQFLNESLCCSYKYNWC